MAVLAQYDVRPDAAPVRLRNALTLRVARPGDAVALQAYFRSLGPASRYNRLMAAASELPQTLLEAFVDPGRRGGFSIIATLAGDVEAIIAESRYALDPDTAGFEFGLSVADRWQGQGFGSALLADLECRAAEAGAATLFGDTLRNNVAMVRLARKSGFAFAAAPQDWKQVRFEKHIEPALRGIPCAGWEAALAAPIA
jgi:GNAT superfamily N-acetyltransferase